MRCLIALLAILLIAPGGGRAAAGPAGASSTAKDGTADDLQRLRDLVDQKKWPDAEKSARALLPQVENGAGAESPEAADVLSLLVEALFRTGKPKDPETRQLAERALAIREKLLPPEDPRIAASLQTLANALSVAGDLKAAGPLFERCIALREKTSGPESPELAKALYDFALLLKDEGDYARSRSLLERVVSIQEKARGPDHPEVARAVNSLGNALKAMGELEAARAAYERALTIFEKGSGPESAEAGKTLSNLGSLHRMMGHYDQARSLLTRSAEIAEKIHGADHPETLRSLGNLGNVLFETNDYPAARPLYERVLSGFQAAYGTESFQTAGAMRNLANLFYEMGDFEKSLPLHRSALIIFEKSHGPDHPSVAVSLHNIAELLRVTGDYASARPLFERSVKIRETALGPNHPDLARSLRSLGFLLRDTGDLAGAKALLQRALNIREKALGPQHPNVGSSLASLATVLSEMGDYAAAQPLFERAIALEEQVLASGDLELARVRVEHAQMLFKQGLFEEAIREALRSEASNQSHFMQTARILTESEAFKLEAFRQSGLDVALSAVALADGEKKVSALRDGVWNAVLRSRAMVLDEMASRHRSVVKQGGETSQLERDLMAARSRLAQLYFTGPNPDSGENYQDQIRSVEQEKERAERELAEKSSGFRRELARLGVDFSQVVKALPAQSALIAYVKYNQIPRTRAASVPSYLAFATTARSRTQRVIRLGPADRIETLVEAWRKAVREDPRSPAGTPEQEARRIGETLRRAIWDPVASELSDPTLVFLVPDGPITLVNLGALPNGRKEYLVESPVSLHTLSAERDLASTPSVQVPDRGLIVVGAPDFDAKIGRLAGVADGATSGPAPSKEGRAYRGTRTSCGDFRALRFEPLPASLSEAEMVRSLWAGRSDATRGDGDSLLLQGPQADEATFKAVAPGHRIIHLATHGFSMQDSCPSALGPSRSKTASTLSADRDPRPVAGDNPLLLTGLALAGANRRDEVDVAAQDEDGILTAEEIASLDLLGVDWAVLSACETGLGRILSGEGVLGLRRAFEVAGARTLIMSLWSVEDDATRVWMRGLYEARFSGASTTEAIRKASLEMIEAQRRKHQTTHPYFWGGFVAAGDWR